MVAGLALFLGGLEGVPGRAVFERGEVPHDGGVAGVHLDILHFLFLRGAARGGVGLLSGCGESGVVGL